MFAFTHSLEAALGRQAQGFLFGSVWFWKELWVQGPKCYPRFNITGLQVVLWNNLRPSGASAPSAVSWKGTLCLEFPCS